MYEPPPSSLPTRGKGPHRNNGREWHRGGGRRSSGQGGAAKGAPRPSGRESCRLLQATEAEPGARRRGGSSRAPAPATRAGAQALYGAAAESTAAARTLHGGHGREDQHGGSSSSGVGRTPSQATPPKKSPALARRGALQRTAAAPLNALLGCPSTACEPSPPPKKERRGRRKTERAEACRRWGGATGRRPQPRQAQGRMPPRRSQRQGITYCLAGGSSGEVGPERA